MPPIRLGVIGAGLIWARTHASILATMADVFEPVAFCDLSEERRAAAARAYPDALVVSDYARVLEAREVDAVLVLTPIALNAPVAQAALRAGKDVLMEKPLARSVAEGAALIAEARAAGRWLGVLEQVAYRRAGAILAEALASGAIGDLVMWERVMHLDGDTAVGPLRFETTPWRKEADFPLGTMFDGGVHLIAGLARVFGAPQSVLATGRSLRPEYGAYDHVAALFQYEGGLSGMLSHSSYLPPGRNHFHIYGAMGTVTVERERVIVEPHGEPPQTIGLPEENASAAMWRSLGAALQGRRDPDYTPEQALCDVATLEAIDEAIRAGRRVAVRAAT
jgi:predicted dehydrogenase